ncbi:NADAR family protein [Flammeovirga kamogawensis]|uniref:NADAR family protein n=1 Tax=Flammeovirga kamogawensis TaxID=373891 RepID=A0ABX8H289_9BACT|nr:NADAR family protein [Flammeovirga kamogawensis]MBB6460131.1 ribA/ribD-fused uncharacterized protein [Flammeovirga kamogawensis]QWG09945.1 NADAR family protein [Flammeovirga kamogawensis]TRX65453.1 NADAR family protein [Flammeovirga kamogawensis]
MIYPGGTYRSSENLEVYAIIHFETAYTEYVKFTLPNGELFTISFFSDPLDNMIQVWLNESKKYESEIVGNKINSEKYSSYSLILNRVDIINNCESLIDFNDAIYFYSSHGEFGEFSNFSNFGFEYENKYYKTVEHFYQSMKFEDLSYAEKIRLSNSPKIASDLGQNRSYSLKKSWEFDKINYMYAGVKSKFDFNEELQKKLIETDDKLLIENSPYDNYWGIGKDGLGQNQLGTILMRVREKYKQHTT